MSENEDQSQSGKGLRDQLEAALAEINTLKQQVETSQTASRELAFVKAGIDTENGVGKLLAKTYDGELDPEAIKTYAQEYGIEVGATQETQTTGPQREQIDPAQQRMDSLRAQSRPAGEGERMSHTEFLTLNASDPQAARAAFESGSVDVPPHIANQLAHNQASA